MMGHKQENKLKKTQGIFKRSKVYSELKYQKTSIDKIDYQKNNYYFILRCSAKLYIKFIIYANSVCLATHHIYLISNKMCFFQVFNTDC